MKRIVIRTAGTGDTCTFQIAERYAASSERPAGEVNTVLGKPINAATADKIVNWIRSGDSSEDAPQMGYAPLDITLDIHDYPRSGIVNLADLEEMKTIIRTVLRERQMQAEVEQNALRAADAAPTRYEGQGRDKVLSVDEALVHHGLVKANQASNATAAKIIIIDPDDPKDKGAAIPVELPPQPVAVSAPSEPAPKKPGPLGWLRKK